MNPSVCRGKYVCSSLVRFSLFRSPLKIAIDVPSYVNKVKGHVELILCELF